MYYYCKKFIMIFLAKIFIIYKYDLKNNKFKEIGIKFYLSYPDDMNHWFLK